MEQIRKSILLIVIVLSITRVSYAPFFADGSLDRLINAKDSVVVVAEITSLAGEQNMYGAYDFDIEILRVLKGEPEDVPTTLTVREATIWPYELELRKEPGTQAFFVFKKVGEREYVLKRWTKAIFPAIADALPDDITEDNLSAVITDNLFLTAPRAKSQSGKAKRVSLIADVCPRKMRDVFVLYLQSEDIWIRRATLGLLAKLSPQPQYFEAIKKDFFEFFGPDVENLRTSTINLFLDLYGDALSVSESSNDLERAQFFLPVYRLLVDNCWERRGKEIGLAGLGAVGTKEDLLRIYSFRDAKHQYTRRKALEGISRILNLNLASESEDREPELQRIVKDALIRERVLTEESQSSQDLPIAKESKHKKMEPPSVLLIVTVNEKKGYIDKTGKFLIKPQFDELGKFSEGLAPVQLRRKWGYIDITGEMVVKPQFDDASSFSEGLAAVKIARTWGYIDKTGKMVIRPQFDRAFGFSEGLARIELGTKSYYIDRTGRISIEAPFDRVGTFYEGLTTVKIGDKWGYIDKTDEIVIKPQFDIAYHFSEGLGHVKVGDKWGYVDRSGNTVIEPQFDEAYYFYEGMSWIKIGEKIGFIDKTGKIAIKPQFDKVYSFCERLAPVRIGREWGYVDKTGKYIIPPGFDRASCFSEGLAPVEIDGKWGYIDRTGKIVIEPRFHSAWKFSHGLARVNIGGDWHVSESGLTSFSGGRWGYIDRTGKYIWKPSN